MTAEKSKKAVGKALSSATQEGRRKLSVFIYLTVIAMLARALGWISGDNLADILTASLGLYMAGNVGEHWTRARSSFGVSDIVPPGAVLAQPPQPPQPNAEQKGD
jgi:hypothetical protein